MVGFFDDIGFSEASGGSEPEISAERRNLVTAWCGRVKHARNYLEDTAFKQMRKDMQYARFGADPNWEANGNYVANIIHRHVKQTVSTLYAKNPKAEAKRRKRLEFRVWDGKAETYQSAVLAIQQNPLDPNAMAIIADIEEARQRRQMLDKVGKTLEILFGYYTDEQKPSFKKQMKQLVRRVGVCGVGYLELGYQRIMEQNPDVTSQIADMSQQIASAERIMRDLLDGELADDAPEVEELRITMRALQEQEETILREGPLFLFPRSTEIIFDPMCRDIDGFIGARWIATEFSLWPDKVKEIYKVDIGLRYTPYQNDKRDYVLNSDASAQEGERSGKEMARLWRVQDKQTGAVFTICDGYPDFLKEPQAPAVKLERFFTVFPLTFNDTESEKSVIPFSDVYYMLHMQDELNRARQGLREHKKANRPAYVSVKGRLEEEDKSALSERPPNAIIELSSLAPKEKVEDLLQPVRPVGIDPNVYEVNGVFDDVLRVVGAQEANFGPVRGKNTATESAIAESSRNDVSSSNVDDLDEFLSEVVEATGQLMLLEIDAETAAKIAGPGSVWPQLTREEIVKSVYLNIKAGSSGKPNVAAELANFERGMPFVIQMPGINPMPLGKKYLELLDIDADEAVAEGLPSIVAMNAAVGRQAQADTGDGNDPKRQGAAGGDNAPRPPEGEPGPQPAFPTSPEDFYMPQ